MDFIKSLFSEHGDASMLRLMSLISCISAVVIAIVGLNKPVIDYSGLSFLCGTFLGIAFTGKVMQKRTEIDGAKAEVSIEK